jgi:hypothetical protein
LAFLPSHYYAPSVSWESLFAERVEEFGRFVSLGRTSDELGADRIETSDDTWIDDFVILASFADQIFIWPSTRPGTRWEIKWLLEHELLPKCIFVVANGYDDFIETTGESWNYVRAFLLMLGLNPPVRDGTLFAPAVAPVVTRRLSVLRRRKSLRAIRELLSVTRYPESAALRWNNWYAMAERLRAAPAVIETEELGLLLPCVECGRALSTIVCAVCEHEPYNRNENADLLFQDAG